MPQKSKGNIHFYNLKETRKMTFNLVIICLFICISKCTSFWIHTESGNIENGCHFPSFEYESFVISSAWDLFSFCSDVTQVTSKWGDKKSCFYDFGYKDLFNYFHLFFTSRYKWCITRGKKNLWLIQYITRFEYWS